MTWRCLAAFCRDTGYFNTFGGNPVAAAAGLAVLEVIETEALQANAAQVGAHLLSGLKSLSARSPRIADVRGAGLFIGVDLCTADAEAAPDPEYTVTVINALREAGILIGAAGRFGATLKVRPPLCLTAGEADQFLRSLTDAIED